MTDDFHFDTEIIIVASSGDEDTEADSDLLGTELANRWPEVRERRSPPVWRYRRTCAAARAPEFEEYFVHYPIKNSAMSHYYARRLVGCNHVCSTSAAERIFCG